MKNEEMTDLNKRERAILKFIEKQIKEKGYPPSVREIGKAVGLSSTATVHGYIAKLTQKGYIKKEDQKVLDCFKEEAYLDEQKARAILASFHFYKDDVNKIIKNLSGGERVRLKLAILLQGKVNCLIFDEPTNHIDISTKEVLENAISDFKGTLIFISHDRFFINKFANKVIEFKNGQIRAYIGNYDNYKEHKNVDKWKIHDKI